MVTKTEAFLKRMQIGTREWESRIALYEKLTGGDQEEEGVSREEALLALRRHLSVLESAVRDLERCPSRKWDRVKTRVIQAWDSLAEAWSAATSELAEAGAGGRGE
jgi:hypothetical protein